MKRVLLIDVPHGGLAGIAKSLASATMPSDRLTGKFDILSEKSKNEFSGILVHHRRHRDIALLFPDVTVIHQGIKGMTHSWTRNGISHT